MKVIKYIILAITLTLVYNAGKAKAQLSNATVSFIAVPSTALAINCPAPTVGYTIYCKAADKYQISANGAAYITIWPVTTTVAGITQLTVNGTPCTGPTCSITIPTKVTINPVTFTAVTPTGTIQ